MKKTSKTLFDAISQIDDELLEQAQDFQPKKKRFALHTTWGALAACLVMTAAIGTAAYATGLTDTLASYFHTEEDTPATDAIAVIDATAANSDMELRIDGVIADKRTCHMVVSFIGLNEKTKDEFARGNLSVQEDFSLSAVTRAGEQINILNWESATYTEPGSLGKTKSKSMLEDADMTYVISYLFEQNGLHTHDIDTLHFAYQDLVLTMNMPKNIYPEYTLRPINAENSSFTEFSASCIGFYLTAKCLDENDFLDDLRLIRTDGTLLSKEEMLEIGYSANYSDDEIPTEIYVEGRWGVSPTVAIINLDEYSGIQVNGVPYFFVDKPTATTQTQVN